MPKVYVASGWLEDGKLHIRNRRQFDRVLSGWRDCPVTVTVERAHAVRSKAQNDYYHAVVVDLVSETTGYDAKETHELLKALHLPQDRAANGTNGRLFNGLVIGGSTTKLNKLEFIEYLERIVRWGAEELGIVIPDPDPNWREAAARSEDAA